MISMDTVTTALTEFAREAEKDSNYAFKLVSDFAMKQPNFAVLVMTIFADSNSHTNSMQAALVACCLYEKLIGKQEAGDNLRDSLQE